MSQPQPSFTRFQQQGEEPTTFELFLLVRAVGDYEEGLRIRWCLEGLEHRDGQQLVNEEIKWRRDVQSALDEFQEFEESMDGGQRVVYVSEWLESKGLLSSQQDFLK